MRIDDLRRLIDEHFDKEDFKRSLEYCDLLASEYPSEQTTEDIFKKGLCHYRLDDIASALSCFDRALEREPENILALTNKGICLYGLERIPEAFALFNRIIKINPEVFPPWYYIGFYYLKKYSTSRDPHDLAIAVNACRRLLDMVPDYGEFPVYDPVRQRELRLDFFLYLHNDVEDLTVEEMTTL